MEGEKSAIASAGHGNSELTTRESLDPGLLTHKQPIYRLVERS